MEKMFKVTLRSDEAITSFFVFGQSKDDVYLVLQTIEPDELCWDEPETVWQGEESYSRPLVSIQEDPPFPNRFEQRYLVTDGEIEVLE